MTVSFFLFCFSLYLFYNRVYIVRGIFGLEDKTIRLDNLTADALFALVGVNDRNIQIIEDLFQVELYFRDGVCIVKNADDVTFQRVEIVINALKEIAKVNREVSKQEVIYASRMALKDEAISFDEFHSYIVSRTLTGKAIVPRTYGQFEFVKAMDEKTVVFALGPAGTGKTFLAVIKAVGELKKGNVKRIVLTRPAVEAGESLGFLPGDMKEKVDPYLTPLYDALHVMLGNEQTEKLIEKGVIEIAPLAYMRGRTLDHSFVILDEAQNTTPSQMKMFLTRLGYGSKMVLTGDVTQVDLNLKYIGESGMIQASNLLKGIDEIGVLELSADDVVRHPLVQKMIERYELLSK